MKTLAPLSGLRSVQKVGLYGSDLSCEFKGNATKCAVLRGTELTCSAERGFKKDYALNEKLENKLIL